MGLEKESNLQTSRDASQFHNDSAQCESFLSLYSRSYHSVYAYALAMVGSTAAHVADDVMQEVGLLLWEKFDEFEQGTDFEKWSRAFVRNVVRNHQRKRRPVYLSFDDDLLEKLSSTRIAADEWLEARRPALKTCLSQLSQRDQNLVSVCYLKHKSIASAARELSQSLNAVYKQLRRIRIKLFQCVEKRLGFGEA